MLARQTAQNGLFDLLKTASPSQGDAIRRMEMMAKLLDNAFVIPGTNQRVGIDAIIGLVPGLGDIATTVLSSYVIWEARNLGVSRVAIGRMLTNLAIHASIGAIPILGTCSMPSSASTSATCASSGPNSTNCPSRLAHVRIHSQGPTPYESLDAGASL